MRRLDRNGATLVLLTAVFLLITFPVWRWLWGEWLGNDYYSHGFLIVPIALYLAWRKIQHRRYRWSSDLGDNRGFLLLLLPSALLYVFFFLNDANFLAAFAMVGLLAGLVWTFGGHVLIASLLFPLAFLLFMIPLPVLEKSTLPLALLTGFCAGTLAQWLGLDVTLVGQAVSLPNTKLVIGAQCSGINSMISLFALTSLAAYAVKGPWWGRLLLVLLSIPLAMLGNIMRVSTLFFVARRFGANVAFSYYHDYSGIVAFLLLVALIIPLSKLLQCKTVRYEIL